jgi:hypothetical protein
MSNPFRKKMKRITSERKLKTLRKLSTEYNLHKSKQKEKNKLVKALNKLKEKKNAKT